MIVPILLCTFLGTFLDRFFGTRFIVIILFFLGALAGFRNIFVFAKNAGKKTTHLGSDTDSKLAGNEKEDFVEATDRVYRENLNEETSDHS